VSGLFKIVFGIEEQRDWQTKPGCSRNPFSCFFCHLLNVFNVRRILDLNYGVGGFYTACPHLDITGVDIRKWDWLVEPRRFIQADMEKALGMVEGKVFDAAVMDPPFATKPSSRIEESGREYLYFGNVPFPKILRVIRAVRERGIARYVILKYMPASVDEEIELLRLARYRIMWRFTHRVIAVSDGNKVVRNYTELFII
jgi:tRNA1(Val) A37 N6-methylase TrmN6